MLIRNVYEINPKSESFHSISEMWAKSTLIRMFYNLILCTTSANHKFSTLRSNVYGTNPNKKKLTLIKNVHKINPKLDIFNPISENMYQINPNKNISQSDFMYVKP